MKFFSFLAIFSLAVVAVLGAPKSNTNTDLQLGTGSGREPTAMNIVPKDWLTDLIMAILGIGVGDLLRQINVTLAGIERLVTEAVTLLMSILSSVSAAVQAEIRDVINKALIQGLNIIRPILDQLGLVLPAIPPNYQVRDIVSDLIAAILGISLEELLTTVATALIQLDQLMAETVNDLKSIATHVSPVIANEIDRISDICVVESQGIITAMLNKLYQILPIKNTHKILIPGAI